MNYLFGPYTAVSPPPDIRLHSFPILRTSSLFTFLIHLLHSLSAFTFCIHLLHSPFAYYIVDICSSRVLTCSVSSATIYHLHATQSVCVLRVFLLAQFHPLLSTICMPRSRCAFFACFHLLSFIGHHLPSACHTAGMRSSRVSTCSVLSATEPPMVWRISSKNWEKCY